MKKTETVYGSASFDGSTQEEAYLSIGHAMGDLKTRADEQDREVLWDTLEVSMERDSADEVMLGGERNTVATWHTVNVSALAVKRG